MEMEKFDDSLREERRRRTTVSADKNEDNKKDYYLRVLSVQLVLCALITICVYGVKRLNSDAFAELKGKYDVLMADGENKVGNAVKSFFDSNMSVHAAAIGNFEDIKKTPEQSVRGLNIETVQNSIGRDIKIIKGEGISAEDVGISDEAVFPVNGTLSSGFDFRTHPINGVYSFHAGIDLAADEGTPIKAAYDGILASSQSDSSFGKYVIIEHSGGLKTVYAHCSSLEVKAGDEVLAGDVIAKVGSTGKSTGNHLHFEVRIGEDNIRLDPNVIFDL